MLAAISSPALALAVVSRSVVIALAVNSSAALAHADIGVVGLVLSVRSASIELATVSDALQRMARST